MKKTLVLIGVLTIIMLLVVGCAKKTETVDESATTTEETVMCPVTGTETTPAKAYDKTEYEGKTYYFCCAGCKPEFEKDPQKYLNQETPATKDMGPMHDMK